MSSPRFSRLPVWLPVLAGLLLIVLAIAAAQRPSAAPAPLPTPTRTPEPLRPTPTPTPTGAPAPTATPAATATAAATVPPAPTTPGAGALIETADFQRFGVSGTFDNLWPVYEAGLPFAQFMTWGFNSDRPLPPGVTFWQMIRTSQRGFKQEWAPVLRAARANPGSIWIIGNEPDVRWQDNVTPEKYAELYHEAVQRLRAADPTARIAPAGVAQATPLRLAYLDAVLRTYRERYGEPLPADVWTLHTYILREERDSWGVDIPPGLDAQTGELYEIADHDDVAIFRQQIERFREWMAANGYQDRPLAITEFGILLPNDYGFPPERVAEFMVETLDAMLTMRGPAGMPADNGRFVQYWFWYSVEDLPDYYPTGDLFKLETGRLTLLGETWRDYLLRAR